jgi:PAS domain S-box-containing protein
MIQASDIIESARTEPAAKGAPPAHLVQFYETDEILVPAVAKFLGEGLGAGDALTVIATEPHRHAFQRHLESEGFDLESAVASGQLAFLDADETLAKFMREGQPDRELFESEVGGLIARRALAASGAPMRAYGEMVDVLWKRGDRTAAIRLEELWNDLQSRYAFTLLCAYAMGNFYKQPAAVHEVCRTHTRVVGEAWEASRVANADVSGSGLLPQYAYTLAREIAHREEVESALRESLRELRQKEAALRRSEEQLRDFVENATLGLHRVGPDGTILWANRAEMDLLGYDYGEYVGHPIAAFHADRNVSADMLARLSRGEALQDYEARLRAQDGTIKHVLIDSKACFHDGKFIQARGFTRDVTQRRKAEDALRRSEQQLQSVTDALPVLVSYVDAGGRYRFVSAAYERWFGRPKPEIIGRRVEDLIGPAAYEAIRPRMEQALAGQAVAFEAELPYQAAGRRFIEATYTPQFAADGSVAGYVALVADVTERKSFERFRAAAAARAERLVKITGAVADAVTAPQVFEAVVDHVAEAVDASTAALWLVDDDGRTVTLARSVGYPDTTKQRFESLSIDGNPSIPALDAIRRREPLWIPSRDALVADYPHLGVVVTSGRSYRVACLPLISQGRTLGALGITIEEEGEASEEERDFLVLVARYAGQAIERVRLLEAERRSRSAADLAAARMGVLSRASRTFVDADLDLAPRLQDIVIEMADLLGSAVSIALLEADDRLHSCALHHPVPEARQMLETLAAAAPVALGEGITGSVASTGQSAFISGADAEAIAARAPLSYRPFLDRFPIYAMICAPLRARGKVIGVVSATRTRPGETYARQDLALLEELAERAAPAIENSRLHRENVAARARAERLYHFAKSVVSADRVEDVFEAALDAIEGGLGTNRGAILIYDDSKVMRFRASRRLSEEYRRAVEGHSPWTPDAVSPQPVLVGDVDSDATLEPYRPLFKREGIGSLAFVPLVTRGRLIGKFMVYYGESHTYSTAEIEMAMAIANHLASVTARFTAIAKLEETIRYNDLFSGVLAHDLRNPLGAITTSAQMVLMRQEGEGDRNSKPLSRILASGQRMMRMIDQLLDLTRARAGGGIRVEPCETNLADLCEQAIGELEVAYPSWRIQRQVVGDQAGSWDVDRLLQVISNLVSNAGQHGQADGVIGVILDGRRADAVTLEVHNDGSVPEAILPTLFDPFRGTRNRRDYSRGLGLGLFIVNEIVRAHGGTVRVVSTVADGTTFTVRLPRRTPGQ